MKIVKRIVIAIIVLILLIVVVSFFLPSKIHVERSVQMNTKPSIVFALVNDLKKWEQWSPWHQIDTTTIWIYSENPQGEGAWYTWESKNSKVGKGKLTLIRSVPFSLIVAEMNFGPMGIAMSTFRFDSSENGLNLTWVMDSEGKGIPWYFYVMSKYINLFMDKNVGHAFENGLDNLKKISEAIPQKETIAGFDVEEKMLEKMNILSIRGMVKNTEIGMKIGQSYSLIGHYMARFGIKETGSPLTIWHQYGPLESEMEAAIPVDSTAKSNGKIIFSVLPATHAFVVKYFGAYDKTAPVYEAAKKYIEDKGKKNSGPPREVYVTDPGMEKDTAKWLTEIVFPVE